MAIQTITSVIITTNLTANINDILDQLHILDINTIKISRWEHGYKLEFEVDDDNCHSYMDVFNDNVGVTRYSIIRRAHINNK